MGIFIKTMIASTIAPVLAQPFNVHKHQPIKKQMSPSTTNIPPVTQASQLTNEYVKSKNYPREVLCTAVFIYAKINLHISKKC